MCVQSQCFASEDFGTAPVAKTVQRYHTQEYSCGEAEVQQAASEASETLSRSTNNSRCYGSLRTMKHDLLGITVCSIASITANRDPRDRKVNSRPTMVVLPGQRGRRHASVRACVIWLKPDQVTVADRAIRRLIPGTAHDARIAISVHSSTTAVESRRLLIGATNVETTTATACLRVFPQQRRAVNRAGGAFCAFVDTRLCHAGTSRTRP